MASLFMIILFVAQLGLLRPSAAVSPAVEGKYNAKAEAEVITRDVCIIGGGASGTYAAIRLQDAGKSVVVVEKENALGGHAVTYVDPATRKSVGYGVEEFHDLEIVRVYLNRLGVAFNKKEGRHPQQGTVYVDMKDPQPIFNFTPPDVAKALVEYSEQVAKYPFLEKGFQLPHPVPEELLMPFADFAQKHNITDALSVIGTYGQGFGDILKTPMIYVFKYFGLDLMKNIKNGFLAPASREIHEIYDKALQILGYNVLLNSRVISTDRSHKDGVKVVVKTPSGTKIIHAKKLILTIPPKLDNLGGFDLDKAESHLFGKFKNSAYYTGLVRNTGFHNVPLIIGIGLKTRYHLANLPGLYTIFPTVVPGLYDVKYGSISQRADDVVKADIIASIKRLQSSGVVPSTGGEPEIAAFHSHTPYRLIVSANDIRSGFYKDLYALQGRHHTFYTGAAFHTHDSSLLWQFTEELLLKLK